MRVLVFFEIQFAFTYLIEFFLAFHNFARSQANNHNADKQKLSNFRTSDWEIKQLVRRLKSEENDSTERFSRKLNLTNLSGIVSLLVKNYVVDCKHFWSSDAQQLEGSFTLADADDPICKRRNKLHN